MLTMVSDEGSGQCIPKSLPNIRFADSSPATLTDVFYTRLGICAPDVVDYLANLLVEFLHVRDIYILKSMTGETLYRVSDMLANAYFGPDVDPREHQRLVHRHVGDYLLYWTGIYPESLAGALPEISDKPISACYAQGRESYAIASELTGPQETPNAQTLHQLSEHFEECVEGLQLTRHNWSDSNSPNDYHLLS